MKKPLLILLLTAVFWGCERNIEPQTPNPVDSDQDDKVLLEKAFTSFIEAVDVHSLEEARQFILLNGLITIDDDGIFHFFLCDDVQEWMDFSISPSSDPRMQLTLAGGLSIRGIPSKVYVNDQYIADVAIVYLNGRPTPVFRFQDGTTYSLSSLLLITPFMDWIIEYALAMRS